MDVVKLTAPAKINLSLHITGRRNDGYHLLDSLIGFTDFGDEIRIEPHDDFAFDINGPFAHAFNDREKDTSPNSSNLAVRAAWALSHTTRKNLRLKITLTKNLPLASGIGGGSADAAAVIWGLCKFWHIAPTSDFLMPLLLELGADVPVCFSSQTAHITGIGENLTLLPDFPEIPIVIANPGKSCSTAEIFRLYDRAFSSSTALPENMETSEETVSFLHTQRNDLTTAACALVPEIENVLCALNAAEGSMLSRMSGSGATCFGLFETLQNAKYAAQTIAAENPDWWIHSGTLGRAQRY